MHGLTRPDLVPTCLFNMLFRRIRDRAAEKASITAHKSADKARRVVHKLRDSKTKAAVKAGVKSLSHSFSSSRKAADEYSAAVDALCIADVSTPSSPDQHGTLPDQGTPPSSSPPLCASSPSIRVPRVRPLNQSNAASQGLDQGSRRQSTPTSTTTATQRARRSISTRLAPPSFLESNDEVSELELDDDAEAQDTNIAFFRHVSTASTTVHVSIPPRTSSRRFASGTTTASSVESSLVQQICERDERISSLRSYTNEQHGEIQTLRKLAKLNIERHRNTSAESEEWQEAQKKAVDLAEYWEDEATNTAADLAGTLAQLMVAQVAQEVTMKDKEACQRDLELERAANNKLRVQVSMAKAAESIAKDAHNVCLAHLEDVRGENADLRSDLLTANAIRDITQKAYEISQRDLDAERVINEQHQITIQDKAFLELEYAKLSAELAEAKADCETLVNHKANEWVKDPVARSEGFIEPDEKRDLQNALEMSMHNHKVEVAQANEAHKVVREQEQSIQELKEEKSLLQQEMTNLRSLDTNRAIVADHISTVKTLFAAASMLKSDSELAMAINEMNEQLTAEKVSTDMMGSLMMQVANLKTELLTTTRDHAELITSKDTFLVELSKQNHDLDEKRIEAEIHLPELRANFNEAVETMDHLRTSRDDWKSQCEDRISDDDKVLLNSVRKQLEFYKHALGESDQRVQQMDQEQSEFKYWAACELESTGLYIEQRDHHIAQVKGLEAAFADVVEILPSMPWRPNFRAATAEEGAQMLTAGKQVDESNWRVQEFRRVVSEYLSTDSHHLVEMIEAEKAKQAEKDARVEQARVQGEAQARQALVPLPPPGLPLPANPRNWAAIVPQVDVIVKEVKEDVPSQETRAVGDGSEVVNTSADSAGWVTEEDEEIQQEEGNETITF